MVHLINGISERTIGTCNCRSVAALRDPLPSRYSSIRNARLLSANDRYMEQERTTDRRSRDPRRGMSSLAFCRVLCAADGELGPMLKHVLRSCGALRRSQFSSGFQCQLSTIEFE